MGVKPIYKHFKHDGVTGPNMATVYSDRGFGVRAPVVFYNRANEAAAQLKPGDFDWKAIFASGVRWVHCGGIFAALSPTTAELAAEMMKEAKAAGAVTSFDLNFREKLWKIHGGDTTAPLRRSARLSKMSMCWWATKKTCRRDLAFRGPRSQRNRSSIRACSSA